MFQMAAGVEVWFVGEGFAVDVLPSSSFLDKALVLPTIKSVI